MLDVAIFPKENPPAVVPKLSVGALFPDPKAGVDESLVSWGFISSFCSGVGSTSLPKPFASVDFLMLPKPRKPVDVPEPNTAPVLEVDPKTGAGELSASGGLVVDTPPPNADGDPNVAVPVVPKENPPTVLEPKPDLAGVAAAAAVL